MRKLIKKRVSLFGLEIDALRMPEAVERVLTWIAHPQGACQYIVTPNVDHAVMFQKDVALRSAYGAAGLVLADGLPVVWASRLLRRGLPERIAGSDLVPELFEAARRRSGPALRVFLLGAMPGVAERATANIERRWANVKVAGVYSPPFGFEKSSQQNDDILAQIADAQADLLIVGLGAPKQELWVHRHRDRLRVPVAVCAGATIDFLAGEKRRAPRWMQRVGLEWFHRMASEPRRLVRRYFRDAVVFPQLVWRELRQERKRTPLMDKCS